MSHSSPELTPVHVHFPPIHTEAKSHAMSQLFCTPIGSTTFTLCDKSAGELGRLGTGVDPFDETAGLIGPETNGVGGLLLCPPSGGLRSSIEERENETDFLLCAGRWDGLV